MIYLLQIGVGLEGQHEGCATGQETHSSDGQPVLFLPQFSTEPEQPKSIIQGPGENPTHTHSSGRYAMGGPSEEGTFASV